ncbi:MAG TPA: ROK family protein [Planctomycetia bacterium]|nr:ROK family protein [Planctomycetia bacterium]
MAAADGVRPYFLGIDLGGTNVKAGVVDDNGKALSSVSQPTEAERGPELGVQRICQTAREAVLKAGLTLDDIHSVGVGSPGPMDLEAQIIIDPHNLPGWINLPLAARVGESLGLRSVLQNDANAAAFGEYWVGAGKGKRSLVQFTLGTGIGSGIVMDGKILEGRHSHGAEAGHMRIDPSPTARLNGTGLRGSLEAYCSASGVVARIKEALEGGADAPKLRALMSSGQRLTAKTIFQAADEGDQLAKRIVDETAFYLAIGAVNLMHVIDPDVVVFSGGMIAAGEPFLEKIRAYVRENALPVPAAKTEIVYAKVGTDAGFIGAAGCARSKFATSAS